MRMLHATLLASILTSVASADAPRPPPMSIDELRTAEFEAGLRRVRDLASGPGYTAYLVAYDHADLTLHAMVAVPLSERPTAGFPIVIANHGYVPDPRQYGITRYGFDARPGDYYRSVPGLFASRGFLTVIPDYRGHNSSEGFAYVDPQDEHSAAYYAEDVVALMSGLHQIEDADTDNVFMWSHSMGGAVSMRALLATDSVRASSFWSTMNVDELLDRVDELDGPVVVQHSEDDQTTPVTNSQSFAEALGEEERLLSFVTHPGDEHFFTGRVGDQAAGVDAMFFEELLQ